MAIKDIWKDLTDPGRRDRREARRNRDEAMEVWGELDGEQPTVDQLAPEYAYETEIMDTRRPELSYAGASDVSMEAQRRALQGLQGIADAGGWTNQERAQWDMMRRDLGRERAGIEGAQQAQMAARGMGGSGLGLMAQLGNNQSALNRGADLAAQYQIEGQRRALQALQGVGQLGTTMRGQSWNEAATRASAVDDWNNRNVDYRRGLQGRNVDRRTNQNRGRADAYQQQFQNRSSVAAGKTNQYNASAGDARQRERDAEAARQAQMQGIVSQAGQTFRSLYGRDD